MPVTRGRAFGRTAKRVVGVVDGSRRRSARTGAAGRTRAPPSRRSASDAELAVAPAPGPAGCRRRWPPPGRRPPAGRSESAVSWHSSALAAPPPTRCTTPTRLPGQLPRRGPGPSGTCRPGCPARSARARPGRRGAAARSPGRSRRSGPACRRRDEQRGSSGSIRRAEAGRPAAAARRARRSGEPPARQARRHSCSSHSPVPLRRNRTVPATPASLVNPASRAAAVVIGAGSSRPTSDQVPQEM